MLGTVDTRVRRSKGCWNGISGSNIKGFQGMVPLGIILFLLSTIQAIVSVKCSAPRNTVSGSTPVESFSSAAQPGNRSINPHLERSATV